MVGSNHREGFGSRDGPLEQEQTDEEGRVVFPPGMVLHTTVENPDRGGLLNWLENDLHSF